MNVWILALLISSVMCFGMLTGQIKDIKVENAAIAIVLFLASMFLQVAAIMLVLFF